MPRAPKSAIDPTLLPVNGRTEGGVTGVAVDVGVLVSEMPLTVAPGLVAVVTGGVVLVVVVPETDGTGEVDVVPETLTDGEVDVVSDGEVDVVSDGEVDVVPETLTDGEVEVVSGGVLAEVLGAEVVGVGVGVVHGTESCDHGMP
jgi:hypothetical protein